MAEKPAAKNKIAELLAKAAQSLDDVSEGIACAGTSLEARTFIVRKKAFLFLGAKEAKVKLDGSLGEAAELAKTPKSAVRVGGHGWTTIRLDEGKAPPAAVLRRWVAESYELFAGG